MRAETDAPNAALIAALDNATIVTTINNFNASNARNADFESTPSPEPRENEDDPIQTQYMDIRHILLLLYLDSIVVTCNRRNTRSETDSGQR
ncbi:hypothetical protein CEP54_002077 [Fusarium duplospermum]|uniref:Uncharacterized protein n=1 Tax=Fusarium duplospermum TaxID=1325734 RepID=A0A428QXN2_9HYPO|nr:hypothetical protein CEP54_002077 [Fusarium duplospermum]